jgi:hypothetical protein
MPAPFPATDASPDAAYQGHYWAGEQYAGDGFYGSSIQMTLTTPNDTPVAGDLYYVILSTWDNAGSYDQIGILEDQSEWYPTWTYSSYCDGTNPDTMVDYSLTFSQNTQYTFLITDYSNGTVRFGFYFGSTTTTQFLAEWDHTGGTQLFLADYYTCQDETWWDYTDYEEVYELTDQLEPNWNWFFDNNLADGGTIDQWLPLNFEDHSGGAPPSGASIMFWATPGGSVEILNQFFDAVPAPPFCGSNSGICTIWVTRGSSGGAYAGIFQMPDCQGSCGSVSVSLSAYSLPSGWTASFIPNSVSPGDDFTADIGVPSTAACVSEPVGVEASANGIFTTFRFLVLPTGCSGGGGCVALGTLILTSSGYVPVQRLRVGESVVGYNVTSGSLVTLTLQGDNGTWTSQEIGINGGALLVTPTEQPIFIKNDTFVGWLRDPQNLSLGDRIYDPLTGDWTLVTSVTSITGWFKVFDVRTSGANDFIASGFLLDEKGPPP